MKFVCNQCRQAMEFVDNETATDGGSMAIRYDCPGCGHSISMHTNPGETQMVRSLGVTIGHEALQEPAEPMATIRGALSGPPVDTLPAGPDPVWTEAALKRLSAAPSFVQGMVHRLYTDYARRQGYREITPKIMSEARDALGMTDM